MPDYLADDFTTIKQRLKEIQKEREAAAGMNPPPASSAPQPTVNPSPDAQDDILDSMYFG